MQGRMEGHAIIFSFCCWLFKWKGFPFQKVSLFDSYEKLNSVGMRLLFSPCPPRCAPLHKMRSPHKPNEAASSLSSLKAAREKVLNSCCLWLIGKMPVFEESQTCSGNFSGNQRCTGGFSCIPGLSRCVQSIKQALMLNRYPCQLLSFHLKLVRNLLWKVFLLEERKKVSLKDQCHHRERKWLITQDISHLHLFHPLPEALLYFSTWSILKCSMYYLVLGFPRYCNMQEELQGL